MATGSGQSMQFAGNLKVRSRAEEGGGKKTRELSGSTEI